MADLIVHDDSTISRTAALLEERRRRITLYHKILRGDSDLPNEYYDVNKEAIQQALENEKWLLEDLIEDIEDGLFVHELNEISRLYVMS